MSTNLLSQAPSPGAIPVESRGVIAAIAGTVLLAARQFLKRKPAARPEAVSRADFYAEMLATRERMHANHRELLAALDRQVSRINALECGLARVDERTRN